MTIKFLKQLALVLVMGMLVACGTPIKTAEQNENDSYIKATDAFKKGDCQQASNDVYRLLVFTGSNRLKQLFKENANAENCIIALYMDEVKTSIGLNAVNDVRFKIDRMQSLQAISENTTARVDRFIEETVKEKIKNGSMNVTFDDAIKQYSFLSSSEMMDLIAINTINKYKTIKFYDKNGLEQLANYVGNSSNESMIRVKLKEALPLMSLKVNELGVFEKIDPKFVSERKLSSTLKAFIEYKSIDRLTADDINEIIKRSIKGVEWAASSTTSLNIISIEKIRHNEVVGQERTQTISYADYQVDRLAALMLMPRNSSYMFDLVSNDVSIDYGYVITYQKNGQRISEEVVRGVESHQNKRCQYKRIQNVFGGNQSADFDANDDMRSKCAGFSKTVERMRSDIYSKIASKVFELEDVKKVHSMN